MWVSRCRHCTRCTTDGTLLSIIDFAHGFFDSSIPIGTRFVSVHIFKLGEKLDVVVESLGTEFSVDSRIRRGKAAGILGGKEIVLFDEGCGFKSSGLETVGDRSVGFDGDGRRGCFTGTTERWSSFFKRNFLDGNSQRGGGSSSSSFSFLFSFSFSFFSSFGFSFFFCFCFLFLLLFCKTSSFSSSFLPSLFLCNPRTFLLSFSFRLFLFSFNPFLFLL